MKTQHLREYLTVSDEIQSMSRTMNETPNIPFTNVDNYELNRSLVRKLIFQRMLLKRELALIVDQKLIEELKNC